MNASLTAADRVTHLKIVALALVAATGFVGVGLANHLAGGLDTRTETSSIKPAVSVKPSATMNARADRMPAGFGRI